MGYQASPGIGYRGNDMAELNIFHYKPGSSFLHRTDTAVKYLSVIVLSITVFRTSPPGLIILTLVIGTGAAFSGSWKSPGKSLRGIAFLLAAVILGRGLFLEGTPLPFVSFLTGEGLISGALYAWRLVLFIVMGHVLLLTTEPSELHGALYRLLHGIPFIPAGKIASMISLTIIFIPLIFDQYSEIRQAYDSRLGSMSRSPMKKITALALPLMETVLGRADEIAMAMESRCYSDDPLVRTAPVKPGDFIFLFSICLLSAIILLLNFPL